MSGIGYLPFDPEADSVEAGWLAERLGLPVRVLRRRASSDRRRPAGGEVRGWRDLDAVVAEGLHGLGAVADLRAAGFRGRAAVLPYVNPVRPCDLAAIAAYRGRADPRDRVFVGSRAAGGVLASSGVAVTVAEPYGIDDGLFGLRPGHHRVRAGLGLPPGPILLYAGRLEPDKDVYRLLRVGLRARVLFPDLLVVLARHVADDSYLAAARALGSAEGVHVVRPSRQQLADLYAEAAVFVTASTSAFETFGRAPLEALACGTAAVAPRFAGFPEVLAQPGATLVPVSVDADGVPRAREDHLLRAVYDVLSDPSPPTPEQVSVAARERYGRSRTLSVLDHLVGGPVPPLTELAPTLGHGRPGTLGADPWSVEEGELAATVRMALWRSAEATGDTRIGQEVGACR